MKMIKVLSTALVTSVFALSLAGCTNSETVETREELIKETTQEQTVKKIEKGAMSTDLELMEVEFEEKLQYANWVESPSKGKKATIEGLNGEELVGMEKNGFLAIENNVNHKVTNYDIKIDPINGPLQALGGQNISSLSPLDFKWIDDENMYILVGTAVQGYDLGGNLFTYNIKDNKLDIVHELLPRTNSKIEEIVEFSPISEKKIKVKKVIYEGGNFEKKRYEEETLNIKQ